MKPLSETFWHRVAKTKSGCWIWIGPRDKKGYGLVSVNHGTTTERAHRVAFKLTGKEIPEGMTLDHLCRTPSCVNPDHLEAVSSLENTRRAYPLRALAESTKPLTPRQSEVLDAVKRLTIDDVFPSLHSLRRELGLASLATVHKHLDALKRHGYLTRAPFVPKKNFCTQEKSA